MVVELYKEEVYGEGTVGLEWDRKMMVNEWGCAVQKCLFTHI